MQLVQGGKLRSHPWAAPFQGIRDHASIQSALQAHRRDDRSRRFGQDAYLHWLIQLFGLPEACIKADEKKADDFWVSINLGGLVTVDNVDSHIRWLADALATASTNGSCSRRKLYTPH